MRKHTSVLASALFTSLFFATGVQGQTTWYVDDDAPLGGNAASWNTAYKYLQDAFAVADGGDEIRVGGGTYAPDRDEAGNVIPGDREATLQLVNGVGVYGGYAGLANPGNPDERDIEAYETVLSGDLNGDDGPNFENYDENSYHVVTGSGTDETAILDGFTVTSGNADGPEPHYFGAGMYNFEASPTLTNCTLRENSSENHGAGMYNSAASPTLTNCTLSGNLAGNGAGMHNREDSNPTLTNCTFTANTAQENGGGMFNFPYSNPTLTDCTFTANTAQFEGGGMLNGFSSSSLTLTNCTFDGNSALRGGGMCNAGDSDSTLANCTFTGNTAQDVGGGMHNRNSNPTLTNCTFSGNSAQWGGGMANGLFMDSADPILTNCTFSMNSAQGGGGMWNGSYSNPTLANCAFTANTAENEGGGMHNDDSSPTLTNCTFSGNTAGQGGGMANYYEGSNPTLANCTFSANSADADGGGMFNAMGSDPTLANCTFSGNSASQGVGGMLNTEGANPTLTSCILWDGGSEISNTEGSTVVITYSNVCGGWPGDGNIDGDPLFVDADGADDILGTEDDNLRLSAGSPCIDAGDNDAVPPSVTTDLDGHPRFVDDPDTLDTGNGTPPIVDMGPYEFIRGERASDDDLDNGETLILNPGGGSGDPTEDSQIEITNLSGPDDASIEIIQTEVDVYPDGGTFNALATTLIIDTSLDDGEFFMTVVIAFDADDLEGEDPLSVDLMYFDTDADEWVIAVGGNTQPSPGHEPDPIGDRFAESGTTTPSLDDLSTDLGDYGLFWNTDTEQGFVWANVDHATGFASAYPRYLGAPLPEDSLNTGCTEESDCYEGGPATEAKCIQGVCYAPKTRYISIARNPGQVDDTARRIKIEGHPESDPLWIGEPVWIEPTTQHDALWLSGVVGAPLYSGDFDTPDGDWPDVLQVSDCEIAPGYTYEIQALPVTGDPGDEDDYSEVLELRTNTTWGDTVTSGPGGLLVPPDGVPGLADIMAAIAYFQGDTAVAPLTWLDIAPSTGSLDPDQVVGLGDIMGAIAGFQGDPYPGLGPLSCP